jgi:hypothetical protein
VRTTLFVLASFQDPFPAEPPTSTAALMQRAATPQPLSRMRDDAVLPISLQQAAFGFAKDSLDSLESG